MKNILLIFLFIFLTSYSIDTVKIASGEWGPYTSEKNLKEKLVENIVTEAFNLVGIKTRYKYYPWKRAYNKTKNGIEDATIPWIRTEERVKDFIFNKEPIIEDKDVIFHLKKFDFKWEKYEDLKKYRMGATEGYYQADFFDKYGIKYSEIPVEELQFKKILAGRIDGYVTSFYVGYNIINKTLNKDQAILLTHNKKPLRKIYFYMLISKKIPNGQKLADKLDEGLKKLKKSGRYAEIIKDFFKIYNVQ